MQRDLQAKTAVAIHFGTFVNEDEVSHITRLNSICFLTKSFGWQARWSVDLLQLACREAGVTLQQAQAFDEQDKALKGPRDLEFVVLDAGGDFLCNGS